MVRASVAVEKLGLPTASIICSGFAIPGETTAASLGMSGLPMSVYPGAVNLHSEAQMGKNVAAVLIEQIVEGLTVQPKDMAKLSPEPGPRDIVFTGTLQEVNRFFYEQEWGDGIPIIPPTVELVEEFLKYTDRSADEVIALLLPDKREATVWNIAVNGVMAGCRPHYMPVLIAAVEALADPRFDLRGIQCTAGLTSPLLVISGKKLIEQFLPGIDLTHVIDTSGAYIPGHGTPTVLLFGRNRRPVTQSDLYTSLRCPIRTIVISCWLSSTL